MGASRRGENVHSYYEFKQDKSVNCYNALKHSNRKRMRMCERVSANRAGGNEVVTIVVA
jgi:hypothetical protein